MFPFTGIIFVIIAFYLFSSIKILSEYERGVIFRLGRLLDEPKGPGLILVFAPLDRMVRVDLRQVAFDVGTEHWHAGARETLGEHLQRHRLAGAGRAGDQPVPVGQWQVQQAWAVTFADEDVALLHGRILPARPVYQPGPPGAVPTCGRRGGATSAASGAPIGVGCDVGS